VATSRSLKRVKSNTVDSDGRARRTRVWRREGASSAAFSAI